MKSIDISGKDNRENASGKKRSSGKSNEMLRKTQAIYTLESKETKLQ